MLHQQCIGDAVTDKKELNDLVTESAVETAENELYFLLTNKQWRRKERHRFLGEQLLIQKPICIVD